MFESILHEMKNRVLLILYSWACNVLVSYLYVNTLLYIFIKPSLLMFTETKFYFIFTDLSEPFHTYFKIILFSSNQLLYFLIIYHTVVFLLPGLYVIEYKTIVKKIKDILVNLMLSYLVVYKYIIPWSWEFFLDINNDKKIPFFFEAKLNEYVCYVCNIYFFTAYSVIGFYIILNYIMNNAKMGENVKNYRKYLYILFIILSSVVTPPDVISQITLIGIVCITFETYVYLFMATN